MDQRMFCRICSTLLTVDAVNDQLRFVCMSCHSHYEAADDDSLRYEEVKGSDIAIFSKILEKIAEDPTNPKVFRECVVPKCGSKIAKYVRLGDEMKMVYSCVKCRDITM
jgi:DNA-directed RNA polymerase subunit M/transcription elongation factor TFIIS